jgi:hypothetical protein
MYFHLGEQLYGKVDVVPGLCYVATRFFHFNFIPLVPLGSDIVVTRGAKRGEFQRLKTTLSVKSVLIAWLRAGLCLAAAAGVIGGVILALPQFQRRHGLPVNVPAASAPAALGLAAVSIVGLWLTYSFTRAGYDRALQLGAELGLEPTLVEQYLTSTNADREATTEPAKEPEGWERYS